MPSPIGSRVLDAISSIRLKILVFGPQVHTPSTELRTAKLQSKRAQIRAKLEECGHHVKYAEELVDPSLAGPAGNALFQELVIMEEYDLIVNIVDSPGSIVEATAIALRPRLASKSSLFLDRGYEGGLVGQACKNAADIGAHYQSYLYPKDLDECNLMGFVLNRVGKIQKMKYLL